MAQSVDQDGVPLLPRVQRRMVRLYQQALGFLQTGVQTDTQAQKPVAGGGSPSRKDLVQIDLADAGGLGQRRLGGVPRLKQCLQRMGQASCAEAGGVFRENAIQIVGIHQLVQKLVCVFLHHGAAVLLMLLFPILPNIDEKNNMQAA